MIIDVLNERDEEISCSIEHEWSHSLIEGMPIAKAERTTVPCEPILLLTACIDPRGMRETVRSNPEIRRQDYLRAFDRWVKESQFQKIVFCENSGADLSEFARIASDSSKEVELLSFVAPKYPAHLGKSYGEILVLEYAIQRSSVIDENSRIMKCTGRLFLLSHNSYYWHGKSRDFDISVDMSRNLSECDVRVFFASVQFLKLFLFPIKGRLDETASPEIYLEQLVGQAVNRGLSEMLIYAPLPCAQLYVGHSGSLGHRYSPWHSMVGRAMRVVPPFRFESGLLSRLNKLRIRIRS